MCDIYVVFPQHETNIVNRENETRYYEWIFTSIIQIRYRSRFLGWLFNTELRIRSDIIGYGLLNNNI